MTNLRTSEADEWAAAAFERLALLKEGSFGSGIVSGEVSGGTRFDLIPLTRECQSDIGIMDMLGRWRQENQHGFLSAFRTTRERTTVWFCNQLIERPDRILFLVRVGGRDLGHVGLYRFESRTRACEVDNIIRGEAGTPGVMGAAITAMMAWGRDALGLQGYSLKVLADNERAVKLYERIGFAETRRIPLCLKAGADGPAWEECTSAEEAGRAARFYSVMTFVGIP